MRRFALALVLIVTPLLAACGPDIYKSSVPGTFDGKIYLMWIDDGGPSGDGKFLFVPVPGQQLTFTRNDTTKKVTRIIPGMMYTDGGSIPRLAQVFKGFSPWGYAPAYMVHDWLFLAKNCSTDGKAEGREVEIAAMNFDESAAIMAEAIRTLVKERKVKPNDVSEMLIPSVVGGPISEGLWHQRGACDGRRVTAEDRAAAEAALPGARKSLRGMTRTLPGGQEIPLKRAQLISELSF
jgi:hypothetical protein